MDSEGDSEFEDDSWDPALQALFARAPANDRPWTWDALDELLQSGGADAVACLFARPSSPHARNWDIEDDILAMDFED
jgi:hypothetical protein